MKRISTILAVALATFSASAQQFKLNDSGYFNCEGIDVMAFSDFYPEGHQGGVCVIMNGLRIATNGNKRNMYSVAALHTICSLS